ncbi:hypothetical protein [Rugamonas sp. DEMB1]|uniref:hypothetical protein n=1 Tax=Rugamonas sp. DEMB1 TaxID=3039386 RepID=UPI002446DF77|nr:hypothetical protein [Rugamonas sp. DEMB1]WGG50779.1 hypothetical protein QC826_00155 [Rugamonas sp. DEMB1]
MLKVSSDVVAQELDTYLRRATAQTVVIEQPAGEPVVMLAMSEFQRLQQVDEAHWAACARLANTEGYLDHEHEVRRRLAAALNEKRLSHISD